MFFQYMYNTRTIHKLKVKNIKPNLIFFDGRQKTVGFKFWEDDDGESTEEVRHVDVNHSVDVIERKKKTERKRDSERKTAEF